PPAAMPTPTPSPTPTPTPPPTRRPTARPSPTPSPVPSPSAKTLPAPTVTPTPTPTPVPMAPAVVWGRVFLDRNGNGRMDSGEPGVAGAVVEVQGRRWTTGPDGTFPLPAGVRAKLLRLPVAGRLTVADGVLFGVQPRRPLWLLGLAAGMGFWALSWAYDPWSREKRRLARRLHRWGRRGDVPPTLDSGGGG
ncbi:MAG: hypothetical protein C4313_11430, partial [Thermoflexus sp.]